MELDVLPGLPSAFVGWSSVIDYPVGSQERSLRGGGGSRPKVDGGGFT
jgi:hypothetical protein